MRHGKTGIVLLLILLLAGCSRETENTDQPKHLKENAYQHLQQGDWQEAVILYEKLGYLGSQDLEVVFNLGVSYYRAQHFGSALLSFERALRLSVDDPGMQSRILHNIGNTLVWRSQVVSAENRMQALSLLRDAAQCYRSSLALQSDHDDTQQNLELTESWIVRLESDGAEEAAEDGESTQSQDSKSGAGEAEATGDSSEKKPGEAGEAPGDRVDSSQQSSAPADQAAQTGASSEKQEGRASSRVSSQISMEEALMLIESNTLSARMLDLSSIQEGSPSPGEPQW